MSTTIENLQAAFEGESNANAKYALFAKKADEEGFKKAAALFRAASRAEEIHFKGHAAVIKRMGAEPKAEIHPVDVKTTYDNLETARQGEVYERDTMYPGFIAQAQADGNKDAQRAFNNAVRAEAEHAVLYQEAREHLEEWRQEGAFYVCPVCGKTVTALDFDKCDVCGVPKERFEKIV